MCPGPLPDATVEHRQSVRRDAEFDQPPGVGFDIDEAGNAAVTVEHHEFDQSRIQEFPWLA